MFIYHIVTPETWQQTAGEPVFEPESLRVEGFIHCSYEHQIDGVIERYYRDSADLLVLKIDVDKLTQPLTPEPSTGGEIFPHLYGSLNKSAVSAIERRAARRAPRG